MYLLSCTPCRSISSSLKLPSDGFQIPVMVTPSIIVHVTALLRSPLLDRIKYIKPLNAANQLPQPDRCCIAGSGLRP